MSSDAAADAPERLDALHAALRDYAALAAEAAERAVTLTRSRDRLLPNGNTRRAADDPQFRRALAATAGRAAAAAAAADGIAARRDRVTVAEARLALLGVATLSRETIRSMFDTLGASATATDAGLHTLWERQHAYETRDRLAALGRDAGAALVEDAPSVTRVNMAAAVSPGR